MIAVESKRSEGVAGTDAEMRTIILQFPAVETSKRKRKKRISDDELNCLRKQNEEFFDGLQPAMEQRILSKGDVREKIIMKRNEILKMHYRQRSVWQGSDGRWRTRLPDGSNNGRGKLIVKTYKRELEETIVNFYCVQEEIPTIRALYPEWLEQKKLEKVADTTCARFEVTWRRYLEKDTELVDKDLTKITRGDCRTWVLRFLDSNPMNRKCYSNVRSVINQIFEFAVYEDYIASNVFKDMHLPGTCFAETAKEDEEEVFNHEELHLITSYLWDRYEKDRSYTAPLAVLFASLTGLRVGELTAMKFTDIDEDNFLQIRRQQVKKMDEHIEGKLTGHQIVDHAKSKSRINKVYVPETAQKILELVRQSNEMNGDGADGFVFYNRHKLMTPAVLDRLMERTCSKVGIRVRRMHCLRKTYASMLDEAGVSEATIVQAMGHSAFEMTKKHYIRNTQTKAETAEQFEAIFSGFQTGVTPEKGKKKSLDSSKIKAFQRSYKS